MKRQNPNSLRKIFRAVLNLLAAIALLAPVAQPSRAATNTTSVSTNTPEWLTRPLSLADCLNLTLQQNGTILKARSDLEASHGIVVQTRAIAIPKVQATGNYTDYDPNAIDKFPFGGPTFAQPHESWNAGVQIVQSIYEGGRMASAFRTAKLTKEQALLQYQTVLADTLLATRVA